MYTAYANVPVPTSVPEGFLLLKKGDGAEITHADLHGQLSQSSPSSAERDAASTQCMCTYILQFIDWPLQDRTLNDPKGASARTPGAQPTLFPYSCSAQAELRKNGTWILNLFKQ